MTTKKILYLLPLLAILLLVTVSAQSQITISNPVDGESYSENITSLKYSILGDFTECWYESGASSNIISISCEKGNHTLTNLDSVEGDNTWKIYGKTFSGRTFSDEVSFRIIPNNVKINFPEDNKVYTTNITSIEFELDYKSVRNCWYSINREAEVLLPSCSSGKNTINNVNFKEGLNTLTILARASERDATGGNLVCYQLFNKSISFTMNLAKNITEIKIIYPEENKTFSYYPNTLDFNLTMENIDSCWYSLNGGTNTTFSCSLGINTIYGINSIEGTNLWTVYAKDKNGNTINSQTTFFVKLSNPDITKPVVDILQPTNKVYSNYVTSSIFNLTEENIDSCWYVLNSQAPIYFSCNNGINTINSLNSTQGLNTLTVNSKDKAGNLGKDTVIFTINITQLDTINPLVNILNPLNTTYSSHRNGLTFNLNEENIDSCWYSLNNNANVSMSCQNGTNIISNIISLEGTNNWIVYAKDKAGNMGQDSVVFKVELNNTDTTNPVVNIINPLNTTYNYLVSALEFKVSDNDPDVCWVVINGATSDEFSCEIFKNNPSLTQIVSFQSQEGENEIFVYAKDKSGNIGFSSINFSVKLNKSCEDEDCCSSGRVLEDYSENYQEKKVVVRTNENDEPITIKLNLGEKLTFWQKLVNWLKSLF